MQGEATAEQIAASACPWKQQLRAVAAASRCAEKMQMGYEVVYAVIDDVHVPVVQRSKRRIAFLARSVPAMTTGKHMHIEAA